MRFYHQDLLTGWFLSNKRPVKCAEFNRKEEIVEIIRKAESLSDNWLIKELVSENARAIEALSNNVGVALAYGLGHSTAEHLLGWIERQLEVLDSSVNKCLRLNLDFLPHNSLKPGLIRERETLEKLHTTLLKANEWLVNKVYSLDNPAKKFEINESWLSSHLEAQKDIEQEWASII